MTKKTILSTIMVITVIAASITASSIAYAAQDPKPKDIAASFFDIFTKQGYTADSFFDVFKKLQTSSARSDSFFDVFFDVFRPPNNFFDVFTKLQGDVSNLESQVADIQSQIGSGGSSQPVRMFMKIEGIPGESIDEIHKNEIDVLSYSWGLTNAGKQASGGGGGEKATFNDFSFVHNVDKASPKLFLATASGEPIPKVEFTVRKAGDKPVEFLKYTFSNVFITSVSPSGTSDDDGPTEKITFVYGKLGIEYQPLDENGDPSGDVVKAEWDLNANQVT
ncbi:MAG: Hcp family type VI secretion system effector [Nitrosopumilaceae archaeon]